MSTAQPTKRDDKDEFRENNNNDEDNKTIEGDEDELDEDEDDVDYYDDDQNNNYICESDDDGGCGDGTGDGMDVDEDNPYANDPEHFEYECVPLSKIDAITEKKCQRLVDALRLDDSLDAVYLLKQFKWNCARIIEMYAKDKQEFVSKYFSDDNNNNSKKTLNNCADKTHLSSYVNLFENVLTIPRVLATTTTTTTTTTKKLTNSQVDESFCQICYRDLGKTNNLSTTGDDNSLVMLKLHECGHVFCIECWSFHFQSILSSVASSASAFECMQTKCKSIADKEFVLKCLEFGGGSDQTSAYKYRVLLAKDLVKESEDLQICPGEKDESETDSSLVQNYTGTPQMTTTTTPRIGAATVSSSNSNIRLVSTISSTPTISFSYVRKPNGTGTTTTTTGATPSTPQFSSITSTPTLTNTPHRPQGTGKKSKCPYIVWCKSKPAARRVVCTSCKNSYCFKCQLPYHAPNSCETIHQWNIKCQDDSETRNYLLVHTQDCPKCKVCIEKNGGCSHMTCNRCKHEFCWVCSNDWKTHGATYDCNRYKGNPEQDNAREALNRYTHYYHRWINHANSLKFEKALREQCALKIHEKIMTRCGGGTLVDWEFLIEAVEVLTRARYTLQYTYPYAYYLNCQNEEEKHLFENIQAELEREVENLSHSLEKVSLNDKYNIRIQMSIVETRRKTLLKDFIK